MYTFSLIINAIVLSYPRLEDKSVVCLCISSNVSFIFCLYLLIQVFNGTFYGIVNSLLLDAHLRVVRLALTMDVNCSYLPQAFGSRSQFALLHGVVPVPPIDSQVRRSCPPVLMSLPTPPSKENPTKAPLSLPPSTRADFYKSPIIG